MAEHLHWRRYTDMKYLRAELFEPREKKVLTIADVKMEIIEGEGGKKDKKPVLYFKEPGVLPMVVNTTNGKMIETLYGTEYMDEWVGKRIQIYATKVKVGGELTPCLRIDNVVPTSSEPKYLCSVCGKEITKSLYYSSIKEHGKAYCSKECLDSDTKGKQLL